MQTTTYVLDTDSQLRNILTLRDERHLQLEVGRQIANAGGFIAVGSFGKAPAHLQQVEHADGEHVALFPFQLRTKSILLLVREEGIDVTLFGQSGIRRIENTGEALQGEGIV